MSRTILPRRFRIAILFSYFRPSRAAKPQRRMMTNAT